MVPKQPSASLRRSLRVQDQAHQHATKQGITKTSPKSKRKTSANTKSHRSSFATGSWVTLPLEIRGQIIEEAVKDNYETHMLSITDPLLTPGSLKLFIPSLKTINTVLALTPSRGFELKRLMPTIIETLEEDFESEMAQAVSVSKSLFRSAQPGRKAHLRNWDRSSWYLSQYEQARRYMGRNWVRRLDILQGKQKALKDLRSMAKRMES